MNHFLFQPQSRLAPSLKDTLRINGVKRYLNVFRWEDRLVAYEESSGLWWGTLDTREGLEARESRRENLSAHELEREGPEAREFWRECLASERVGRLFSLRQGISSNSQGATLVVGLRLYHVLVAQNNSGIMRADDETMWRSFTGSEPWGIRKTLANRPIIWAPGFHTKFARRGLRALDPIYEQEAVEHLPPLFRDLWPQGASALPLRLVAAALAVGWAKSVGGKMTALEFWRSVLDSRPQRPVGWLRNQKPFSLPEVLLQSPEVALPGDIQVPSSSVSHRHQTGNFCWKSPKVMLRVEFRGTGDSAHERLEAGLELRDWLGQFFPSEQVEFWFKH